MKNSGVSSSVSSLSSCRYGEESLIPRKRKALIGPSAEAIIPLIMQGLVNRSARRSCVELLLRERRHQQAQPLGILCFNCRFGVELDRIDLHLLRYIKGVHIDSLSKLHHEHDDGTAGEATSCCH